MSPTKNPSMRNKVNYFQNSVFRNGRTKNGPAQRQAHRKAPGFYGISPFAAPTPCAGGKHLYSRIRFERQYSTAL